MLQSEQLCYSDCSYIVVVLELDGRFSVTKLLVCLQITSSLYKKYGKIASEQRISLIFFSGDLVEGLPELAEVLTFAGEATTHKCIKASHFTIQTLNFIYFLLDIENSILFL